MMRSQDGSPLHIAFFVFFIYVILQSESRDFIWSSLAFQGLHYLYGIVLCLNGHLRIASSPRLLGGSNFELSNTLFEVLPTLPNKPAPFVLLKSYPEGASFLGTRGELL